MYLQGFIILYKTLTFIICIRVYVYVYLLHNNKLKVMKTLFYTFIQNNSGGYFINDDKVGLAEYVIIEEVNLSNAWKKLCNIIDSSDEDAWRYCLCCGERWYEGFCEGYNIPSIYGQPVYEAEKGVFREKCYIHLIVGDKQLIELK